MTFDEHPILKQELDRLLLEERAAHLQKAQREGVPDHDAPDVLAGVRDRLLVLVIFEPLMELLNAWGGTAAERGELWRNLRSLVRQYLGYAVREYHRRAARGPVPLEDDNLPPAAQTVDHAVDDLLLWYDLDLSEADRERVLSGALPQDPAVFERLARKAGMTEEETAYFVFRATQPLALDRDFRPDRNPGRTAETRARVLRKLARYLGLL